MWDKERIVELLKAAVGRGRHLKFGKAASVVVFRKQLQDNYTKHTAYHSISLPSGMRILVESLAAVLLDAAAER